VIVLPACPDNPNPGVSTNMSAQPSTDPIKFAYWVPNVSGGLVTSTIEQRTDWGYDYNRELAVLEMALDLQPGNEIITPSFTYIATTEVIALLKLTPIFVEVDPQTFCIDPVAIRQAITSDSQASPSNFIVNFAAVRFG